MARTSAQAIRSAVPLFSIDWLPAVWPSFGVWRGVAGNHLEARQRQIEFLGGDLRERGEDALPELDLAGEHRSRCRRRLMRTQAVEHAVVLQAARQPALLRDGKIRIEREGEDNARRARR